MQWEKDQKESALGVFWEAVVGTVTTLFKNQPKDRLATKVPIAGSYGETDFGTWTAISTLLRNAFIRALLPKLDQEMSLGDVGDGKGEADTETDADAERSSGDGDVSGNSREDKVQNRRDRPRVFEEKGAERLMRALEEKRRRPRNDSSTNATSPRRE